MCRIVYNKLIVIMMIIKRYDCRIINIILILRMTERTLHAARYSSCIIVSCNSVCSPLRYRYNLKMYCNSDGGGKILATT